MSETKEMQSGGRKPSLMVIFLTVFIDLIGFGIVLPLLPRYSERFGAGGFTIGAIIASFSLMQFLLAPAWGRLSDRIGRRPVLLISNFGSVVSYALFALAAWPTLPVGTAVTLLLASRVFAGACGANLSVATAYIADVTTPENRSRGMAMIGVAFGLGFILGPAIGALSVKHLGLAGPGWVAAGICAANFLLACAILVESRHPGMGHVTERPAISQWGHILRRPKVGLLIGLFSLSTFSFACYESTLPLLLGSPMFHADDLRDGRGLAGKIVSGTDPVSSYLRTRLSPEAVAKLATAGAGERSVRRLLQTEFNRLITVSGFLEGPARESISQRAETRTLAGSKPERDSLKRLKRMLLEDAYPAEIRPQRLCFDEQGIGYIFAYCGLISVLVQGGAIGRLVKRFGEKRVILGSLVIIAGSLMAIPYVGSLTGLLVALGTFSLGAGVNRAPTMALLSVYADPKEQGATMGVAQSAGTLARVVAPVVATMLFAAQPHWPYVFAAVVAVAAALIGWGRLFHGGADMADPGVRAG